MFYRRCTFLAMILCCLALSGCATPGETRAGYLVQGKVQEIINANELAHGHVFGGRVVDTKIVSEEGETVTEHWYVKRGGEEVIYTVMLAPSADGGTDIRVQLPEQDRR